MSENVEAVYRENAALRSKLAELDEENDRLRMLFVDLRDGLLTHVHVRGFAMRIATSALASTPEPEGET